MANEQEFTVGQFQKAVWEHSLDIRDKLGVRIIVGRFGPVQYDLLVEKRDTSEHIILWSEPIRGQTNGGI